MRFSVFGLGFGVFGNRKRQPKRDSITPKTAFRSYFFRKPQTLYRLRPYLSRKPHTAYRTPAYRIPHTAYRPPYSLNENEITLQNINRICKIQAYFQ